MGKISDFYLVEPKDWLFPHHGDVRAAKQRAQSFFEKSGTFEGAENDIEEFVRQNPHSSS